MTFIANYLYSVQVKHCCLCVFQRCVDLWKLGELEQAPG